MVKHNRAQYNPVSLNCFAITGFEFYSEIKCVVLISLLLMNDLGDTFGTFLHI